MGGGVFRANCRKHLGNNKNFRNISTCHSLIFLYFQLDTLFFRLRTISAILIPLHVSGLTGPSAEGENTIGCKYNLDLLMMGL